METNQMIIFIEASFGPEIGSLLISEARCEDAFESVNITDAVHMEPLDSEAFETKQARNDAIRNANRIKANILRLVRTFRREDMQVKMQRDFRDIRPQNSDIERFNQVFEKVKQLWFTKLGTSLEDHIRMVDQVELSGKRVADLKTQLANKVETLEKFKKSSEELKKSNRDDTEKLKKAK